jgi:phage-related protein
LRFATIQCVEGKQDSLDRLRDFPEDARREAGHELYQVQKGLDPSDWKPMPKIGAGVREIRIRDGIGAYRVIYIATLVDANMCCTRSRRNHKRPHSGTLRLPPCDYER